MQETQKKNWLTELPTTDEEALEFLHYEKNPATYASLDGLYKIAREQHKLDILEACKSVLKAYIGEKE